jgi:hypothetical protein
MKTTHIYPRNLRVGDRVLTTNGMREVLSVHRVGDATSVSVQDSASPSDRTSLNFPGGERYRKIKITVERAPKAEV